MSFRGELEGKKDEPLYMIEFIGFLPALAAFV